MNQNENFKRRVDIFIKDHWHLSHQKYVETFWRRDLDGLCIHCGLNVIYVFRKKEILREKNPCVHCMELCVQSGNCVEEIRGEILYDILGEDLETPRRLIYDTLKKFVPENTPLFSTDDITKDIVWTMWLLTQDYPSMDFFQLLIMFLIQLCKDCSSKKRKRCEDDNSNIIAIQQICK